MLDADTDLIEFARADGADIAFTGADGVSPLDHEIERYEAGDLVAWVRVPSAAAASNETIYLYYGNDDPAPSNPSGVWPADRFAGVWHMGVSARMARDSTTHGNTASGINDDSTPASVAGRAGLAAQFDGSGDSLVVGDPVDGSLDFGERSFSVTAWVFVTGSAGEYDMVLHKGGGNATTAGYSMLLGTGKWYARVGDGTRAAGPDFGQESELLGQWNLIALVVDRDAGLAQAFVNGAPAEQSDVSKFGSLDSNEPLDIGRQVASHFQGVVDEVRIVSDALTQESLTAEYLNLAARDDFLTIDPPQSQ